MEKIFNIRWLSALSMMVLTLVFSCKDDPVPEVISGFSFAVDGTDFKKVTFTNASQNFSKLEWNFGDNSAVSADENPVHTYTTLGDFTVTLTATSLDAKSVDISTQTVTISDPNAFLTKLVGDVSKTWKLVREATTTAKYYPLEVGELNPDGTRKGIWWRFGKDEDLAKRPCLLNDEYTFTRNGLTFSRDMKGDFYAGDGGIYPGSLADGTKIQYTCQNVGANGTDKNLDGADISAWRNMNGTFVLTNTAKPTLKVVGNGAYIGLEKVATHAEVKVPQADVTYDIAKLVDGDVDTLVIVANYNFDADPEMDAYWQFVLVHYDNSAQEPPIPSPKPVAKFTATLNGNTLTTSNTTDYGTTYSWDFGDGTTSTAQNPVHTFADDGIYNVKLTATNSAGSNTSGAQLFIANANTPSLTDALLQGNPWKVRVDNLSVFVGSGLGKYDWWSVPKAGLDGTSTGGDNWSCLADDEFTFNAGGVYGYDTKGSVRNDGYFAGLASNGCYSDAELATVTNDGKMFRTFANHSYVLTPASGANRAIIEVTDGAVDAKAFIGFYKGYYGGENGDKVNAANNGATTVKYEVMGYAKGTSKEYLFVTVDISAAKDGSASWSIVLVR